MDNINQTIVSLLQQTYTSNDTQVVKAATQQLFSYAPLQGFLPALMQISTSTTADQNLTMAALSQLKNCLRSYWNDRKFYDNMQLNTNDKEYFKKNIIALNIALSDDDRYGKIIKDIIACIADQLYDSLGQVVTMLTNGQELRTCLNFLLGTIDFFRCHSCQQEKYKQKVINLLNLSVPSLTNLIIFAQSQLNSLYQQIQAKPSPQMIQHYKQQSSFMEQIMYLSIKFMAKIIQNDIPLHLREFAHQWAEVCMNRLNDTNEEMHNAVRNDQRAFWPKRSEIFIYFHSRKWAIEYLYRFLKCVMVYKQSQRQISQQTQRFYQTHLNTLTDVIKNLFLQPQTVKLRVKQLKLLQRLFTNKPLHMKQFLPYYQFEVLPNYIYFDEEDYNLANNPIQFLGYEGEAEDRVYESQNLRAIAAVMWVDLTVQYAQRQNSHQKGEIYSQSLEYIFRLLESNQQKYQLAGVYLMDKLSKKIRLVQSEVINQGLAGLTNYILQHFLKCDDFLLQSKTLEVFITNNRAIERAVRKYVLQYILVLIKTVGIAQLIKINGIIALQMFQTEELMVIDDMAIKDILEVYLDMIMIYELESITVSFRLFVDRLGERAMPYAILVARQLGQIMRSINLEAIQFGKQSFQCFKFSNKSGVWSAAIQTLTVLSQLINNQTIQLRAAIEQQLDYLLYQYFSIDQGQETVLYEQGYCILNFLNNYLQIAKKYKLELPHGIKFYQMVITLKMSRLPKLFLLQDNYMQSYPADKRSVLQCCAENWSFVIMDYFKTLKLFTSFIRGDLPMRGINQIRANIVRSNELEQFFYMILSYYQNKSEHDDYFDQIAWYKGKIVATLLLIYFVQENYQLLRPIVYQNIYIILKMNEKLTCIEDYIGRYNRQLFYIWFWAYCPHYLVEKNQQYKKRITVYILHMLQTTGQNVLRTDFLEQMRRTLLGHCSLLLATLFIPQLKYYQDKVIDLLFAIMKKILSYTDILIDQDECQEQPQVILKKQQINKYQENNTDDPYINEPNYQIQLPSNYKHQLDSFQDQFKREFEPDQIYDPNYTSKLDATLKDQFRPFIETIKTYQKYDPQGYSQKIELARYGALLNTMLQANQRQMHILHSYEQAMGQQFDN